MNDTINRLAAKVNGRKVINQMLESVKFETEFGETIVLCFDKECDDQTIISISTEFDAVNKMLKENDMEDVMIQSAMIIMIIAKNVVKEFNTLTNEVENLISFDVEKPELISNIINKLQLIKDKDGVSLFDFIIKGIYSDDFLNKLVEKIKFLDEEVRKEIELIENNKLESDGEEVGKLNS